MQTMQTDEIDLLTYCWYFIPIHGIVNRFYVIFQTHSDDIYYAKVLKKYLKNKKKGSG